MEIYGLNQNRNIWTQKNCLKSQNGSLTLAERCLPSRSWAYAQSIKLPACMLMQHAEVTDTGNHTFLLCNYGNDFSV